MAKRWKLRNVHKVLDAGCGIGHWGRVLEPYLPKNCKIIGVDQEVEWAAKATKLSQKKCLRPKMFSYQQADVNALDFPDHTFDLVTCQTVLIHVRDPEKTIREFIRVLKPGGLLAVAEPNNMASSLVMDNLSFVHPVQEILDTIKFQIVSQRGKAALGEGHNSIGDLLPGYFTKAGLQHVQTFLSDKACQMTPPYKSPEQKAIIQQMKEWEKKEICFGNKDENLRYFLAGGGSRKEFERLWKHSIQDRRAEYRKARKRGKYHTAGGCIMYLVSGRKAE
jgi:ubiquinone/menaquinone biosynthesis C-methylase UbiE